MPKVGDRIRITKMLREPKYDGKEGVIEVIDSLGQLHGTWGGLAVIPEKDQYVILGNKDDGDDHE